MIREVATLDIFESVTKAFLNVDNYASFTEAVHQSVMELTGKTIPVKIYFKDDERNPIIYLPEAPVEQHDRETLISVRPEGETLAIIQLSHTGFSHPELSRLRGIANIAGPVLQRVYFRLTEPRYREIVEHASDYIYRCNYKGQFLFMNTRCQERLGYTRQEYYGMFFCEVVKPAFRQQAMDFYKRQFDYLLPETYFELPIVCKTGEELWIGQTVNFHIDNGRVISIEAIARDITNRKRTDEKLLHIKTTLEHSVREKEQFISVMSHEIRTPINAISGMANLLLELPYYAEQKEYFEGLKISADNLLNIVNNILDLVKLDSGTLTYHPSPIRVRDLLSRVKKVFHFHATEKKLDFSIHIDDKVPHTLTGDSLKLTQILTNLISNAIKFTEEGGIRIEVRLDGETADEIIVEFRIIDTGIGISPENNSLIFQRFIQESPSISRQYGGSGLGLSITKRLVETLGGAIKVQSAKGAGATFTFTTPFLKDKPADFPSLPGPLPDLAGLSVLVVDDNEISLRVTSRYLEKKGLQVRQARDGEEALRLTRDRSFDLILMDIQLPRLNGIETTRIFKSFNKRTPVLALTATSPPPDIDHFLFDAYILKPFDPEVLYRSIGRAISNQKTSHTKPLHMKDSDTRVTDLSYLHEASAGNESFIREMIDIFLKQTPGFLVALKELKGRNDWEEFRKITHKLKPTIFMMGIHSLKPVIKQIEFCSKELKDLDLLPELLEELERCCHKAYRELEDNIQEHSPR